MFLSAIINVFQRLRLYLLGPSGDGAMLEVLQRLRKHLWGKDVINDIQEGGKSYAFINITLFDVPQHSCQDNTLLIRQEYIHTYNAILDKIRRTTGRHGSAFLVTGQPGIGASRQL